MLVAALKDESSLTLEMHRRLEEVFSPIFFSYAKGVKDRTVWEPMSTAKCIRDWYELASMRTWVTTDAAATEHSEHMSKAQLSQIFRQYMADMKTTLRPDQLDRTWGYYKSCAEAKMRHQAGSTFVANAIWARRLPRLPSFVHRRKDSYPHRTRKHSQKPFTVS